MKYFNGIRLYLKDQETGLLEIRFVCEHCGKEMEQPEGYFIPCSLSGSPKVHETEFYCNECYKERTKQWQREKKM